MSFATPADRGPTSSSPSRSAPSPATSSASSTQCSSTTGSACGCEVGGRVDPDSEAHDLLMSLFGGLAKAERNRLRHRVRAAIAAHASSGRCLGGRPPYGYALIDAG